MKQLKNWIKEFTLTQQLLSIIILFIVIFTGFVYFFFTTSINSFVKEQMFSVLERTQDTFYLSYTNQLDVSFVEFDDKFVSSAVLRDGTAYVSENFAEMPTEIAERVILDANVQVVDVRQYDREIDGIQVLYQISKLENNTKLVSVINYDYHEDFRNTLLNSVINVLFIVVIILFGFLMLWVSSLIRSLNQIRLYIDKVRKNEDTILTIDRKDEIGEVANALVSMKVEIKRQEQSKEELIQNISHDLKTPIATIKSYCESIKDGVFPYETLEKSVDVISEHADRLEKKVQSLLLLNRMGYLVTTQESKEVDMVDIIEKTILSIKLIRPEIEIVTHLSPTIYMGNDEAWRVVLENILDNAMRYAVSKITVVLEDGTLSIENDGPHLSKERQDKLFKAYEKGTDGQFGLGLSIVHRVVTAYNFIVYAENTRCGVIFKIMPKDKPKKKKVKKV